MTIAEYRELYNAGEYIEVLNNFSEVSNGAVLEEVKEAAFLVAASSISLISKIDDNLNILTENTMKFVAFLSENSSAEEKKRYSIHLAQIYCEHFCALSEKLVPLIKTIDDVDSMRNFFILTCANLLNNIAMEFLVVGDGFFKKKDFVDEHFGKQLYEFGCKLYNEMAEENDFPIYFHIDAKDANHKFFLIIAMLENALILLKDEPELEYVKRMKNTVIAMCSHLNAKIILEGGSRVPLLCSNDGREKFYNRIDELVKKIKQTDSDYECPHFSKERVDVTTSSSGGCFIATAVYGSYDCPEVWTLRRYRDFVLAENFFGRCFVKFYYTISPTLVKWFGNTKWFQKIWKYRLDRLVTSLQKNGIESSYYEDKNWMSK